MKTKKTSGANVERKRFIFLEVGIIVTLILAISAFEWKSKIIENGIVDFTSELFEEEIAIENTFAEKRKLPPPPPLFEIDVVDNTTTIIEPAEIPSVETSGKEEIKYKDRGIIIKDEAPVEEFTKVNIKPKFKGKDYREFAKFIADRIKYPDDAKENHVSGTVFVTFIIDEFGNLTNASIYKGIHKELDDEVLRVINLSDKWTPGIKDLKPVKVHFIFPVTFSLIKN